MISTAERIKTNWLLLDDLDMWDEFIIKKNDEKNVKDYYSQIEGIIDEQLRASIDWLETPEAKQFFFNEAEYSKEVFESLDNKWDKIINGKYSTIDELLDEFYNTGKQKGYSDIKEHIRFTDADKLALTFAKNYNFHLIRKLSNDLRNNVKNKIIKSAIGGENPNKLANVLLKLGIKPLPNMTLSAKQRAVMIAKTETSRIQNTGILQSYVNEGYTEVTILTSEDDHVCYTCLRIAYEFNKDDEVIYSNNAGERTHNIRKMLKSGNYPPFHPNCRCTVLPVWKTKGEPPENPYVVDLTAANSSFWINYNAPPNANPFMINADKLEQLKNSMSEVDFNNLNSLLNQLNVDCYNCNYEWMIGNTNKRFPMKKAYTSWERDNVFLPEELKELGDDEYISFLIHNHAWGMNLLPSDKDIKLIINNNVRYGVITNNSGLVVIKNNNPSLNKLESSNIGTIIDDCEDQIIGELYSDRNIEYDWSDKHKRILNEYMKENHEKYFNLYCNKLQEKFDIDIIFINRK